MTLKSDHKKYLLHRTKLINHLQGHISDWTTVKYQIAYSDYSAAVAGMSVSVC